MRAPSACLLRSSRSFPFPADLVARDPVPDPLDDERPEPLAKPFPTLESVGLPSPGLAPLAPRFSELCSPADSLFAFLSSCQLL